MGQVVTAEERHEGVAKGGETLNEGFEGRFSAGSIAQQQGDEVKHVVETGPTASEADTLADGVEEAMLREVAGQDNHLGEPGGNGRNIVGRGVKFDGGRDNRGHTQLLGRRENSFQEHCGGSGAGLPLQLKLVAQLVGYCLMEESYLARLVASRAILPNLINNLTARPNAPGLENSHDLLFQAHLGHCSVPADLGPCTPVSITE